jgi:RNA polymerase sigma-70 factor (ECF subfamily)
VTEEHLIAACKRGDRKAQQVVYDRFAPRMLGLCRRYVKRLEDAEDVLLEAFFKVFTHLDQFRGSGSLEGWVRRIVVNESLMFLRRKHNFNLTVDIDEVSLPQEQDIESQLARQDILDLMDELPTGYRTVFNLYVIEGYKHREIAAQLDISINTSKSQLLLAKRRLQELIRSRQDPTTKTDRS